MTSTLALTDLGGGLYAAVIPRSVTVRAACPRCPWRGVRNVTAATPGWRQKLAGDVHHHTCTAPDQESA